MDLQVNRIVPLGGGRTDPDSAGGMHLELERWFSVSGDLDDFIYYQSEPMGGDRQ